MKNAKYYMLLVVLSAGTVAGGCFSTGNFLRLLGDTFGDALFLGAVD